MILIPAPLSASGTTGMVGGTVIVALLAAACITDIRERRIPNLLVLVVLTTGLLFAGITSPTLGALGRALSACALGFALWIPLYALRMLGAGDVKLFAAASTWLVPAQVLQAALYTAYAGGVLSVIWLVLEYGASYGLARATFLYFQPVAAIKSGRVGGETRRHIPYGIAIAVGVSLAVWLPRFA